MRFQIVCPKCARTFAVDIKFEGRKVQCSSCRTVFRAVDEELCDVEIEDDDIVDVEIEDDDDFDNDGLAKDFDSLQEDDEEVVAEADANVEPASPYESLAASLLRDPAGKSLHGGKLPTASQRAQSSVPSIKGAKSARPAPIQSGGFDSPGFSDDDSCELSPKSEAHRHAAARGFVANPEDTTTAVAGYAVMGFGVLGILLMVFSRQFMVLGSWTWLVCSLIIFIGICIVFLAMNGRWLKGFLIAMIPGMLGIFGMMMTVLSLVHSSRTSNQNVAYTSGELRSRYSEPDPDWQPPSVSVPQRERSRLAERGRSFGSTARLGPENDSFAVRQDGINSQMEEARRHHEEVVAQMQASQNRSGNRGSSGGASRSALSPTEEMAERNRVMKIKQDNWQRDFKFRQEYGLSAWTTDYRSWVGPSVGDPGKRPVYVVEISARDVVGVEVAADSAGNCIGAIAPCYELTEIEPLKGFMAREGYVVTGVNVNFGGDVRGVQFICCRRTDEGLNVDDSYTTEWFGQESSPAIAIGGQAEVAGFWMNQGLTGLKSIGIIVPKH